MLNPLRSSLIPPLLLSSPPSPSLLGSTLISLEPRIFYFTHSLFSTHPYFFPDLFIFVSPNLFSICFSGSWDIDFFSRNAQSFISDRVYVLGRWYPFVPHSQSYSQPTVDRVTGRLSSSGNAPIFSRFNIQKVLRNQTSVRTWYLGLDFGDTRSVGGSTEGRRGCAKSSHVYWPYDHKWKWSGEGRKGYS